MSKLLRCQVFQPIEYVQVTKFTTTETTQKTHPVAVCAQFIADSKLAREAQQRKFQSSWYSQMAFLLACSDRHSGTSK